jgi:hypothetical protein
MAKRLLVFTLLISIIAVLFTSHLANSAAKPQKSLRDQVSIPVRKAPVYAVPTMRAENVNYDFTRKSGAKFVLNTGRSDPAAVGYTTYDNQHNCTMARQVEHRGTNWLHFSWMAQDNDILGQNRGIAYQAYQLGDPCAYIHESGGIRIETDYAGYVGVDADPGGWAVVTAHQKYGGIWHPCGFWDYVPGGPVYGDFSADYPLDIYGWWRNPGTGPNNSNMWPKIEWHIGTETVLHMVTTEIAAQSGDPHTISYYRRVGSYGIGNGAWTDQRLVDTVMSINATVASSPVSDKVAIVWDAPADYIRDTQDEFVNQYENDVWYAVSTNQGADWAHDTVSTNLGASSIGHMVDLGYFNGGNITNYDALGPYKAYCDLSALITTEDELHIAWGCRRWADGITVYRRRGAIFHWAENTPVKIRTVVDAKWDTGGTCYGHAWGTDVAKMSLSECDGKLYLLFTQFGTPGNPCGDVDNDNNVLNGRLYMSAYDPSIYDAWDHAQKITDVVETPDGCLPGDMTGPGTCNSEYWASMARYGRLDTCLGGPQNVLDILYINDYAPGSSVQTVSGVWTVNPVMWTSTLCRNSEITIPKPFEYLPEAFGLCYGEPVLIVKPDSVESLCIDLQNSGMLDINVWTSAQVDSCSSPTGGGATTINISPAAGTIPGKGGNLELTVDIVTTGEETDITIYAHILIEHDVDGFDPVTIPICMLVTDQYYALDWFTLETACKRLRIYNNGQIGNNSSNESMDFINDPDDCADIYLYDASPIICRDIDGERKCFFSVYDGSYASDHALRPYGPVIVDSTSSDSYIKVSSECITADSAIGLRSEYFAPKSLDSCEFIIKRFIIWNRTQETLSSVAFGEVLDWDIPNWDHGSNNESGFDFSRNLIYQHCCTTDPCDSSIECLRYGGVACPWNTSFKNYVSLENDVFVYTSGPFGGEAPLPDDTIYGLMTSVDGPDIAAIDSCEDLSTLITYNVQNLYPVDTTCLLAILVSSRNDPGGGQLKLAVGDAHMFLSSHEDIVCSIPYTWTIPGDANNDSTVNIADAVYIIAYVFKGGPAPVPYTVANGDANSDCECNVGDVVFIINYVFKGGPAPLNFGQWMMNCYYQNRKP